MTTKAARGTKRTCQACEARFYDLNKNPATCPMCGAVQAKDPRESRRTAERVEEEDELPVAAIARTGVAAGAGAVAGATATSEELPEIVSIEDVPEIEGEDEAIEGEEADTFLEEEEEDGDDVGTFIDNPIEGNEEEA